MSGECERCGHHCMDCACAYKAPDLSPDAIERLADSYELPCLPPDCRPAQTAATLRALAARVEALAKELSEQDYEYNRKTNDLIERHAKQIEALTKERDEAHHNPRLATASIDRLHDKLARLGAVERETLERAAGLIDASDVPVRYILSRDIRAIPLNPDAAAALERALQAERAACAAVAEDALLSWGLDADDAEIDQVRSAILARGKEAGK